MAMSVVGKQSFCYIKYLSRVGNNIGVIDTNYDAPLALSGQVQAVARNLFEKYGLDFQKTYLMFYISREILDVERDVSGDKITFAGNTYQCLSITNWFPMNGWCEVLTVQITDDN